MLLKMLVLHRKVIGLLYFKIEIFVDIYQA